MTTFLVLLLFWTYGHVYNYFHPLYPIVFDYKFIGACWLLLFVVGIWLIRKSLSKHDLTPVILNLITAFLVLSPAIKIIPHYIQEMRLAQDNDNQIMQVSITGISEPKYSYRPDIYYIILDSYPRENILREYFNFNNSNFLLQLEELGFYIADCSQSNYAQTSLSLSSSLNYRYLDEIVQLDPSSKSFDPLIKKSSVQRILENWGYKLVAFETGHVATELTDAAVYFSRTKDGFLTITEFDISFFETSLLKPFLIAPFNRVNLSKNDAHRARTLFVLDKLAESIEIQGPKFVFAHILLPHTPFVFGPDGEAIDVTNWNPDGTLNLEKFKDNFVNQTIYTNKRVLEIVKKILTESLLEPIIILQGDHGPRRGKIINTSILNAYYMPGGSQGLYETITPVNTFRYIFNTYFGQKLVLSEDIARFSLKNRPLEFEVIPNKCKP
jgi:hypothetical protein